MKTVRKFVHLLPLALFATPLLFTRLRGVAVPKKPPTGFAVALPGYKYSFPRDHGSHPAYASEWWYYTGHLETPDAKHSFGYQLTFFRVALASEEPKRASAWATRDVIFAHLALTDQTGKKFYYDDRISRAALQLAGAQSADLKRAPRIWLGNWNLQFTGKGNDQTISAKGVARKPDSADGMSTPFGVTLTQQALKAPVINGINGVSQKSSGAVNASHYYAFTRLATRGTVQIGEEKYSVSGQSWFDHEFGSSRMSPGQTGWDWFSIQLSDGRELMLYQLRDKNGAPTKYSSGTLVEINGAARHLRLDEFTIEVLSRWQSPRSGGDYPARWRVKVPGEKLTLEIEPTLADQELDTSHSTNVIYWEGSANVTGTQNGRAIFGKAYVELTGYANPSRQTL